MLGRPASARAAKSRCEAPSIGEKLEMPSSYQSVFTTKALKSLALPGDSNPCFRRERASFIPTPTPTLAVDRHSSPDQYEGPCVLLHEVPLRMAAADTALT